MRRVLHTYQNTVTGEIVRVGGHVAKLMGDGVLAYFGWPLAHWSRAAVTLRQHSLFTTLCGTEPRRLSTPSTHA